MADSQNPGVTIDFQDIVNRMGGANDPYPVYEFGVGAKTFWSNFQDDGVYDKPTEVVDGVVVHLPDPDNHTSTNP